MQDGGAVAGDVGVGEGGGEDVGVDLSTQFGGEGEESTLGIWVGVWIWRFFFVRVHGFFGVLYVVVCMG